MAVTNARQAIADQLHILYQELDGLHRIIAGTIDPEERTALRSELAEVRRCIEQEKGWLAQLDKEAAPARAEEPATLETFSFATSSQAPKLKVSAEPAQLGLFDARVA